MWCKAGTRNERAGEEGIAHFLEHMVFKGSKKQKAGEFDQQIEALGGISNAETGLDDVHFYVVVPTIEIIDPLNLLLDIVLNPSLKKDEFEREKEVIIEEIAQCNDLAEEKIYQRLFNDIWGTHHYRRPILGSKSNIENCTVEKMRRFHTRNYQAKNIVLSIAGKIPKDINKIIKESYLAKINLKPKEAEEIDRQKLIFNKGHKEISLKRLEKTRLIKVWPIDPANHQKSIIASDLAATIIGEGRRSRLVEELKENLKIVEEINVEIMSLEEGGLFIIEASCEEKNVKDVITRMNKILKDIKDNSISTKELDRAKRIINNTYLFSLEKICNIASLTGYELLWGREQTLINQIKITNQCDASLINNQILNRINPENSYTLIAKPDKK